MYGWYCKVRYTIILHTLVSEQQTTLVTRLCQKATQIHLFFFLSSFCYQKANVLKLTDLFFLSVTTEKQRRTNFCHSRFVSFASDDHVTTFSRHWYFAITTSWYIHNDNQVTQELPSRLKSWSPVLACCQVLLRKQASVSKTKFQNQFY